MQLPAVVVTCYPSLFGSGGCYSGAFGGHW